MQEDFAEHILFMLKSGLSFEESLKLLLSEKQHQATLSIMLNELNNGGSYLFVSRHFFSWWCPYPFKMMTLPEGYYFF